jgi:hypothetical protein
MPTLSARREATSPMFLSFKDELMRPSNLDREDVRVCRDLTHRTDTTRGITLSNRGAALATENASRRLFPVSACRQNN